jgi:hypothetical protein
LPFPLKHQRESPSRQCWIPKLLCFGLEGKDFGTLELYLNGLYQQAKVHPNEEYKLILTYRALAKSYKSLFTISGIS